MVNNDVFVSSLPATDEEIAAARQEEVAARERSDVTRQAIAGQAELGAIKPMQYSIRPSDQAAWVPVWEMMIDADGQEYGVPTRAPRGQLGLYLMKQRGDGGKRFQIEQPARVAMAGYVPCLRQDCTKRMYSRQDMVMHVQEVHPREAVLYKDMLDEIMHAAAADNPRVAEIAEAVKAMPDRGVRSMPTPSAIPTPQLSAEELSAGAPQISSMGIKPDEGCPSCDWKYKPEWSDRQRNAFLLAHIRGTHKDEL